MEAPKDTGPSWLGKIHPNWNDRGNPDTTISGVRQALAANEASAISALKKTRSPFGVPVGLTMPPWQSVLEQKKSPVTDEEWRKYHGALGELDALVSKGDPYAVKYNRWRTGQLEIRPTWKGG